MSESRVGCLGKIDQEAIGAAMESVTRSGSTRLGAGPAMFRIRVFHFEKICRRLPTEARLGAESLAPVSQCNLPVSEAGPTISNY